MVGTRFWRLIALFAVPALLLTACPADEPEEDDDVTVEPDPETDDESPMDDEPVDDDALRIGYLLPETGPLAFLGPAQITAVEMAIDEINEAGGVLGSDVELIPADEAGDAAVASSSVDRLLSENVHAIVGAAASGMSLAVIDSIVGAGVLQCSASNTADTFTTYDDDGLYFRTAPSDVLQGPALAEVVIGDGHTNVVIMARGDDYGQGFADNLEAALTEAGATVADIIIYDPEAATYSAEIEQAAAANPDAIVTIPFDEGAQILQELIEAGLGPAEIGVYGADGIRDGGLNESVDPGDPNVIDGFRGTAPDTGTAEDSGVEGDWRQRFDEYSAGEEPIFSAQAYDCTTLVALSAVAAGTADGRAMADEMVDLTRGDNPCSGFEECAGLLQDGESIAYTFVSGAEEFTDAGEPAAAWYEVWEWIDGELQTPEVMFITEE